MSQIPHLLVPYLDLPEEGNLTLLTSVLGASTNWLVLRYLQTYLKASTPNERENGDVKVLLVSLLRDAGFWREGARKLVSPQPRTRRKRRGVEES